MVIDNTKLKDLIQYYDFYATKDGEECLPKTYYYTKYGGLTGGIYSVYEMAIISQPSTLSATLSRFAHFSLPCAGAGFVFGSTLCALGQFRKKDAWSNHVIAGACAGAMFGFKYNRVTPGHVMGVLLGALAGYWKFLHLEGIPIFEIRPPHTQRSDPRFDFSIKMYDDPGRPDRA